MAGGPRKRLSLTHVGGPVETAGDAAEAARLAAALAVAPGDEAGRAHVHGFHTYPARMHPVTAARLVAAFAPPGGRVLDPFCGSGTVPVEALVLGRAALGVDLNPLAVLLARCKTRPRDAADLKILVARAEACAGRAETRRRRKDAPVGRFDRDDVRLFEPHVLRELDSFRMAVDAVGGERTRADLRLVLSSLLVKLSRRRGDTSRDVGERRTAAGSVARLFVAKARELADRLAAFSALVPRPTPPAVIEQDDATALRVIPSGSVDAIVTSPPYAGTYDYVEHHDLRLRWLGLDPSPLRVGEIGKRSAYETADPASARQKWRDQVARFLRASAHALAPGAPAVLVMADSAVRGVALRADEIVFEVAEGSGLEFVARASQLRPHFHGPTAAAFRHRPRAEHALLLRRADT